MTTAQQQLHQRTEWKWENVFLSFLNLYFLKLNNGGKSWSMQILLCSEGMIQRILMACRFLIAAISRWEENREFTGVRSTFEYNKTSSSTLSMTNGIVNWPKLFLFCIMLFDMDKMFFHCFNKELFHWKWWLFFSYKQYYNQMDPKWGMRVQRHLHKAKQMKWTFPAE